MAPSFNSLHFQLPYFPFFPYCQLAQSWVVAITSVYIDIIFFTLFRFPNLYYEYLKVLGSESHGSPARCSLRRRLILTLRPLAASAGKFDKLNFSFFIFFLEFDGFFRWLSYLMHACVTADLDLYDPTTSACFVLLNPILTNPDLYLLPAGSSFSPLKSSRTSDVALQMASLSSSLSSGWLAMCLTF